MDGLTDWIDVGTRLLEGVSVRTIITMIGLPSNEEDADTPSAIAVTILNAHTEESVHAEYKPTYLLLGIS